GSHRSSVSRARRVGVGVDPRADGGNSLPRAGVASVRCRGAAACVREAARVAGLSAPAAPTLAVADAYNLAGAAISPPPATRTPPGNVKKDRRQRGRPWRPSALSRRVEKRPRALTPGL